MLILHNMCTVIIGFVHERVKYLLSNNGVEDGSSNLLTMKVKLQSGSKENS